MEKNILLLLKEEKETKILPIKKGNTGKDRTKNIWYNRIELWEEIDWYSSNIAFILLEFEKKLKYLLNWKLRNKITCKLVTIDTTKEARQI